MLNYNKQKNKLSQWKLIAISFTANFNNLFSFNVFIVSQFVTVKQLNNKTALLSFFFDPS